MMMTLEDGDFLMRMTLGQRRGKLVGLTEGAGGGIVLDREELLMASERGNSLHLLQYGQEAQLGWNSEDFH